MEVAHNEFVETDGLAPQTFSDLAAQHQNIMNSGIFRFFARPLIL